MKKILLTFITVILAAALITGCAPSRRGTGCPMTDKIIH